MFRKQRLSVFQSALNAKFCPTKNRRMEQRKAEFQSALNAKFCPTNYIYFGEKTMIVSIRFEREVLSDSGGSKPKEAC